MPPVLRIADLRVAYRSTVVLQDVHLALAAGTAATVAGPNGAGKTSLFRAVSGLLRFHGGRITDGRIHVEGPVAHVLEGGRVFADLTVEENLRAGGHQVARSDLAGRVRWVLERFPALAVRLTTRAGHLSGGERQLLAIGRGLVAPPRVLLLDEPTVGLAAASVAAVAGVVHELITNGTAVLVAEPEPSLLPHAPVVRLDKGRVVTSALAGA